MDMYPYVSLLSHIVPYSSALSKAMGKLLNHDDGVKDCPQPVLLSSLQLQKHEEPR